MRSTRFHIGVVGLLLAHLVLAVGLELLHTDRFLIPGDGRDVVRSHECGAMERHIAINALHDCFTCVLQLQHSAVDTPAAAPAEGDPRELLAIPGVTDPLPPPLFLHNVLRGPPAA